MGRRERDRGREGERCILIYKLLLLLLICSFSRYYVLYKLPQLTFLDSRAVSAAERKEAKRVGEFMRVVKPSKDVVSLHACAYQPLCV